MFLPRLALESVVVQFDVEQITSVHRVSLGFIDVEERE